MCGRYGLIYPDQIPSRFDIEGDMVDYDPHYNIAPGRSNPVVLALSPNHVELMQWGFIPHWADDPKIGYSMINARAETVAEKPAFKKAFQFQRCIIPASGFYEWQKDGKEKRPFYIHLKDQEIFGFAGLYSIWKDPDGKEIKSYTIITTTPNKLMEPIHNRMPVILHKEDEDLWVSHDEAEPDRLLPILRPYPTEKMEAYVVSELVNNPRNDIPKIIEKA
jgi:putative SOS response-associated peptidase YedK